MNTTVWRWFPHGLIATMGIVFVVNGYMVYDAYSTFPGISGKDGFDVSNEYKRVLETAQQQAALGWQLEAGVADDRFPVLRLTDRTGAPLSATKDRCPGGTAGWSCRRDCPGVPIDRRWPVSVRNVAVFRPMGHHADCARPTGRSTEQRGAWP